MKMPERWIELSPLLDELLDLEGPARTARLDELRGRDADLADELAAMLETAFAARAARFLSLPVPIEPPAQPALVGKRIGAYVIESELGGGGTGSVWRARRADGRFDAVVAIKLLHLSLLGRSGAARFHREGALLSRLAHPNVAKLLDAGVTPEGQPYLVLEYVEGVPIDEHCDQHALDVEQRLGLLRSVMSAVMHAHGQLIVHRDIKPSNILVTPDGVVKLLDFGIAKLLQDKFDEGTQTAEGQLALTPRYAAPEQLQRAPLTTATDVYALGVLMYGLLSGRHPTSAAGAGTSDVIRDVLAVEPARLSNAFAAADPQQLRHAEEVAARRSSSAARLRRRLRGDLDAIVHRALRKRPSERFASVAAFDADIERHLAHEPIAAHYPSLRYRSAKFLRRNRGALSAAVLVAASAVAGVAGIVTETYRAQHERDRAMHQLRNAEASREFVRFLMSTGSEDKPVAPALLARGEQLIERQFATDPEQRARLQLMLANLYGEAAEQAKAETLLQRAQANARDVGDVDLQMEIQCQLGIQVTDESQMDRAFQLFDAAIAKLRATPGTQPSTLAVCIYDRGQARAAKGERVQALQDAETALAMLGPPRPDQLMDALAMRGLVASLHGKLGHAALAVAQYRSAAAEIEGMGRGQTAAALNLYNNLGVALNSAGQQLQAATAYRKALDIGLGLGHTQPVTEGNYARVLTDVGRPREAMRHIDQAMASLQKMRNPELESVIPLFGAPAWCAVGDTAQCGRLLKRAQDGFALVAPRDKAMPGLLYMRLAQIDENGEDDAAAQRELERAVENFDATHNRGLPRALALLARLELQRGELQPARAHAERAVQVARERLEGFDRSSWLGVALVAQGLVQQRLGDEATARQTWRAALDHLQPCLGDDAPDTLEARRLLGLPARDMSAAARASDAVSG